MDGGGVMNPPGYEEQRAARLARLGRQQAEISEAGRRAAVVAIEKCEELLQTETDPERIAAYRERIAENQRRLAAIQGA